MLPNRKSKDNKVACVVYYYGEKYSFLGKNAINSFSSFHPDVDLYTVNDVTISQYLYDKAKSYPDAIKTWIVCHFLMKNMGYEKVIKIGGDTITCDRLDAFLDDMKNPPEERAPVLATLDFWGYQPYIYVSNDNPKDFVDQRDFISQDNLKMVPSKVVAYLQNIDKGETVLQKSDFTVKDNKVSIYEGYPWDESQHIQRTQEEIVQIRGMLDKYFDEDRYEELYKNKKMPVDSMNLNSDIICFNDIETLSEIIRVFRVYYNIHDTDMSYVNCYRKFSIMCNDLSTDRKQRIHSILTGQTNYGTQEQKENFLEQEWRTINTFHFYYDQGALNIYNFLYGDDKIKIVDITNETNECYNVRGYGTANQKTKTKGLKDFYIKDNKLYNQHDRQIKILHYCDSIGANEDLNSAEKVKKFLDGKFHSLFSKDVISFLKKQCRCENIM